MTPNAKAHVGAVTTLAGLATGAALIYYAPTRVLDGVLASFIVLVVYAYLYLAWRDLG